MKRRILLILTVICFSVFMAFFVCRGVSAGGEMAEIEANINMLEKENLLLEKKIAQETSCAKLFQKASNQGFQEISLDKSSSETVALKR